jgi:hypothetical protein
MHTHRFVFLAFFISAFAFAQQKDGVNNPTLQDPSSPPTAKIWGSTFFDYYYDARDPATENEGQNGFTFRRIYVGYDQVITSELSSQVLLEANEDNTLSSGPMSFFVKDAYLEWKDLIPMSGSFIGLSPTPSISASEDAWSYRSLDKVILDRLGLVTTSDMGLSMVGNFSADGREGYAVMIGNGSGTSFETDKFKKFYGALNFKPVTGSVVQLYADYENVGDGKSQLTGKALVSYANPLMSVGAEAFYRLDKDSIQLSPRLFQDVTPFGVSVYNWSQWGRWVRSVLRVDYVDPDLKVNTTGTRQLYVIAAIDILPMKDVHIMPNVLFTHYLNKVSGQPAITDLIMPRLTFAYSAAKVW